MLILGLNPIHPDASAALVGPAGVIAAIAEERLTRQKHSAAFPARAVAEVLRIAGASPADVTDIALAHDPRANLNAKIAFLSSHPAFARVPVGAGKAPAPAQAPPPELAGDHATAESDLLASMPKARIHRVEHHKAHLASAFFCSAFDKAAVVSADGSGDWCSGMTAAGRGTSIEVLARTHPPHSLGVLYTAVSGLLGFRRFSEEYKVMGLSALGEDRFSREFAVIAAFDPERGVRLDPACFTSGGRLRAGDRDSFAELVDGELLLPRLWSDKMEALLGPARRHDEPIAQRHKDIARSLQACFERIFLATVRTAVERTGSRDVCLAGGCAQNAVANGKLLTSGVADRLFVQPAAGDDGTALGAALHVLCEVHAKPRPAPMTSAYLGPAYSTEEIRRELLVGDNVRVRELAEPDLLAAAATAIAAGKVVGWFQGREEWGPRALGNRSILAHPGLGSMKDTLNTRVKMRENFRPFAPAVLAEKLTEVYEGSHPVPFMNIVYPTKVAWRAKLPAVTHADGSGRVQSVSRENNPLFHGLIGAFEKQTGLPVLLNTSFNENEPIVHTPAQAAACFARTRMDALGIGPFWCEKNPG
jgi:carbamoyltransferase